MKANKKNVYAALADDIKRRIELGLYAEGDALPSCREYALERGVNPNTVQRAYTLLEEEGYIVTYAQRGSYVKKRTGDVNEAARSRIEEIKAAGDTREELMAIIDEVYGGDND